MHGSVAFLSSGCYRTRAGDRTFAVLVYIASRDWHPMAVITYQQLCSTTRCTSDTISHPKFTLKRDHWHVANNILKVSQFSVHQLLSKDHRNLPSSSPISNFSFLWSLLIVGTIYSLHRPITSTASRFCKSTFTSTSRKKKEVKIEVSQRGSHC